MSVGAAAGGDERENQAIAWLVRLNAGESGDDDWRAHETWLAADPANIAAFACAEALWAEIDEHIDALKRSIDAADLGAVVVPLRPRAQPARQRAFAPRWAAAAAALVLAFGGGLYGYLQARPVTYQTAPGEIRSITLADGSRIVLNGASRLAVRYDRAARRVTMTDAQAQFDVTTDPARPFLITAGTQRIFVVGTAFDVDAHDGALTVTVRRGVVEVAGPGPTTGAARVAAGFQLTRRAGDNAAVIKAVDPQDVFGWRQRRLVYHSAALETVAGDLNRAFPVPITVRGAAHALRFSGVLVLDDEDAVVRRLQSFLPVEADQSPGGIVLSARP